MKVNMVDRYIQLYACDCVELCSELVLSSQRLNIFMQQFKEQQRYINFFKCCNICHNMNKFTFRNFPF